MYRHETSGWHVTWAYHAIYLRKNEKTRTKDEIDANVTLFSFDIHIFSKFEKNYPKSLFLHPHSQWAYENASGVRRNGGP